VTGKGKRNCPNFRACGRRRRPGEIFCHACYFRLPQGFRDLLWSRNVKVLQPAIIQCLNYLKSTEDSK
jgi:hypothetical protein